MINLLVLLPGVFALADPFKPTIACVPVSSASLVLCACTPSGGNTQDSEHVVWLDNGVEECAVTLTEHGSVVSLRATGLYY